MIKTAAPTPLMNQYLSIKKKYANTILLFLVGDFYETFSEDAILTSKILGIVLTRKAMGAKSTVELAGFPKHALDLYLPKLVKAGYRVAICDQLEDPKQTKGLVKRGVTELVTPGLTYSDMVLDQKTNNYLAALYFHKTSIGIAFLDLSTGEFSLAQGDTSYMQSLLQGFSPAEVIINKTQQNLWHRFTQQKYYTYSLEDWVFQFDYAYELLTAHFGTSSLKGFGIENYTTGIIAAGVILHYLTETEHKEKSHIRSIIRLEEQHYLWLDGFTIRALELITPQQTEGTSLIETLDQTITPMGTRLLKKWILFPLKEVEPIQERLNIVEYILQNPELEQQLIGHLNEIGDLERLISKVATSRINPREMISLKQALAHIQPIKTLLGQTTSPLLHLIHEALDACCRLVDTIQHTLLDSPPLQTNQGGLIKPHVNSTLDELNTIMHNGKDYLVQLQQKEIQQTHIPSLKISYNRIFGYYLEVPNAHKDKVPQNWIRKQTLSNAERYITEELKLYEENIIHASEKAQLLEQQLYQELVAQAKTYTETIQKNAQIIAQLDCYISFAKQARKYQYCKPIIDHSTILDLKDNRHPVIEQRLPIDRSYVPNNIRLDQQQQIIIITGPNMAGKSALLRQVALTVIMAQMGAFVPATYAHIGIIDKIFTRVGAYDNIAKGESTFMMEMTETASIVHNLSHRSLVIMDEIGRGTSTYDGISIAWSLVEYLHNHPKYQPKTLFATHYHELNKLADKLLRVKNYTVTVQENKDKILFLHKLIPGSSEHSFGIHVAKMAGLPTSIVNQATEILTLLSKKGDKINKISANNSSKAPISLSIDTDTHFNPLKRFIEQIDINNLTPIEALSILHKIKTMIEDKL